MEESRILVVTDVLDAHADHLITLLRELGEEPVRLNSSDVSAGATVMGRLDKELWSGTVAVHGNGRVVNLAAVRSIWWRKPNAFGLNDDLEPQQLEFAIEESEHAVRGLLGTLDCHWVSHPDNIERAGYKVEQLQRAASLGFDVPRTLVTTDPEAVRAFYDECDGKVVYKVLTDPYLAARRHRERGWDAPPAARFVATTPVTRETLARLESVRAVPCQFQQYVPKRTELRVTVIGDELFAAELFTQEHAETTVDSRRYDVDVRYEAARLPDEVAARCIALVKSYGLNFGAVDLIRTPDGRYVFLEINPNGQFLFVEERVPELRMGEAMAACLIRGGNG
jgi:hypothetical protein